jgi:hypothetical protein
VSAPHINSSAFNVYIIESNEWAALALEKKADPTSVLERLNKIIEFSLSEKDVLAKRQVLRIETLKKSWRRYLQVVEVPEELEFRYSTFKRHARSYLRLKVSPVRVLRREFFNLVLIVAIQVENTKGMIDEELVTFGTLRQWRSTLVYVIAKYCVDDQLGEKRMGRVLLYGTSEEVGLFQRLEEECLQRT